MEEKKKEVPANKNRGTKSWQHGKITIEFEDESAQFTTG
jgi:hypothetical protein